MAVQAAQDAGISAARHVEGGFDAWIKAYRPDENSTNSGISNGTGTLAMVARMAIK